MHDAIDDNALAIGIARFAHAPVLGLEVNRVGNPARIAEFPQLLHVEVVHILQQLGPLRVSRLAQQRRHADTLDQIDGGGMAPRAASYADDTRSTVGSSKGRPMICIESGNPSLPRPV